MSAIAKTTLPDTALVVLCERAPRYAIAIRRLLPDVKVLETRHLDDATAALQVSPDALLVLDVEARKAPQTIAFLAQLQGELPRVRTIAGIPCASVPWELLLREAGAAYVLTTPRKLNSLAPWMRAHLARAPQPQISLRERVWQRLPWPEASRAALES
jgi:hypothetical protein